MKIAILCLLLCGAPFLSMATPKEFFPMTEATEFKLAEWYLKHLKMMGEPSLYQRLAEPMEEYRFLYLPTFHHPISVHVTKSGKSIALRAVMLSGKGGYEPGTILTEQKRDLTDKEWAQVQKFLSLASFWQCPLPGDPGGCDGSQWVFEGAGYYRYRLLDVWTPTYNTHQRGLGAFVECGKYLIELSKIKPEQPLY
jgi:hypothetical protein